VGFILLFALAAQVAWGQAGVPKAEPAVEVWQDQDWAAAKKAKHVKVFTDTLASLNNLRTLEHVEYLTLNGSSLLSDSVDAIVKLPKLNHLVLLGLSPITPDHISPLKRSGTLRQLGVYAAQGINDGVVSALAELEHLESLSVNNLGEVSGVQYAALVGCKNLRTLSLHDALLLGDAHAGVLSKFDKLETLSLRAVRVGPQFVEACSKLPNLRQLTVSLLGTGFPADKLLKLTECRKLDTLDISLDCEQPDILLAAIVKMTALKSFTLRTCSNLDWSFLVSLKDSSIKSLNLGSYYSPLKVESFPELPVSPGLESLSISLGWPDESWRSLWKLIPKLFPGLRTLTTHLCGSLTVPDMSMILELKQLEKVEFWGLDRGNISHKAASEIAEKVRELRGDAFKDFGVSFIN
jgi:hypothetical protein